MSLSDKLTSLNIVKQSIKTVLTNKGFDMSSIPFTDYPNFLEGLSIKIQPILTFSNLTYSGLDTYITGYLMNNNVPIVGETITINNIQSSVSKNYIVLSNGLTDSSGYFSIRVNGGSGQYITHFDLVYNGSDKFNNVTLSVDV